MGCRSQVVHTEKFEDDPLHFKHEAGEVSRNITLLWLLTELFPEFTAFSKLPFTFLQS